MSNIDWNLISPIEEQMLKTTYLAGFVDGANCQDKDTTYYCQ